MSADNGTYVGVFPVWEAGDLAKSLGIRILVGEEYRICPNGSDFVINELETYFYTPDEHRDQVIAMFGKSEVFTDRDKALLEAHRLDSEGYTEYGVMEVHFPVPYGELRPEIPEPELPEGACQFCSTRGGTTAYHTGQMCERDPDNPFKIIVDALRDECGKAINEWVIARVVIEALTEKGKL